MHAYLLFNKLDENNDDEESCFGFKRAASMQLFYRVCNQDYKNHK